MAAMGGVGGGVVSRLGLHGLRLSGKNTVKYATK